MLEECPAGRLAEIEALGLVGRYLSGESPAGYVAPSRDNGGGSGAVVGLNQLAKDPEICRWREPRDDRSSPWGGDSLGSPLSFVASSSVPEG
jgi:hypothetical protein